jgi:hypothetical protein
MHESTIKFHGFRVGFLGALALIFITLKLTHYIDWSWWFVTSPLWILPATFLAIMAVSVVVLLVGATVLKIKGDV